MREKNHRRCAFGFALALALVGAACGGGQTRGSPFDPSWSDADGSRTKAGLDRLLARPAPPGTDVAVGVAGGKLIRGLSLTYGERWAFAHAIDARPAVAGSVVVGEGGDELFALDARSGTLLWSIAAGGRLRGAGDDGVTTVVSLAPTFGTASLLLAVRRDGSVVRQIEDEADIGEPAVLGSTALLPSARGFLSAYDLPSGDEVARVSLEGPVSRAFARGGAFFAGERSFTRIGGAETVRLPRAAVDLFDSLPWTNSGATILPRRAELEDTFRLYARPGARGSAVSGDRFVATFGRVALGFDGTSGSLVWLHVGHAPYLGGAALERGFALCDAAGAVTVLDGDDGCDVWRMSIGERVEACVVQADELALPPRQAAPGPLDLAIQDVLHLPDPELAPLQRSLQRLKR